MRRYSAAKVIGDIGFASQIGKTVVIEARNYGGAVRKATVELYLVKGDTLSIVALQGKCPLVAEFGLPGRYEYKI